MSYTIYPEAREKIEKSGIDKIVEENRNIFSSSYWFLSPEDIYYQLSKLTQQVPEIYKIASKVLEILEKPEKYFWKVWKWIDLQTKLFDWIKNFWNYSNLTEISFKTHEILLMTWSNVIEILSTKQIENFKNYWFESLIEFIMTLEAYINESNYNIGEKWYDFIRNWIKTTISWCIHWDFRLYQSDENPYPTISPYWNLVDFRPRKLNCVSGYHSVEVMFLSSILKYAQQIWYNINLKEILDYSNSLDNRLWNFWEFWWTDFYDKLSISSAFLRDIIKYWDINSYHFIPTAPPSDFNYYFAIKEKNLVICLEDWTIKAEFFPEDIPDLIKWIIYQCSIWAWRTSKKRVLDSLNYRFSKDFLNDLEN